MAEYSAPVRSDQPEMHYHEIQLLGTGASAPTVTFGRTGVVTRSAVGVYSLTLQENLGNFVGFAFGFSGTTPAGLAGYNCEIGTPVYNATTQITTIPVLVFATAVAADLAATQSLSLTLKFMEAAVGL